MMRDVSLETIHDTGSVVEESADVWRGDVCPGAVERYTSPLDELVFATVIIIVLNHVKLGFVTKNERRD